MLKEANAFSVFSDTRGRLAGLVLQLLDEVAALEAKLEDKQGWIERLQWVVRMVLNDLEENDNPCLSVAAVGAVLKMRGLVEEQRE
jgi:hypothetical protein